MSAQEKITQLAEQMLLNNDELLRQVKRLSPDDQKIYLPKVSEMIRSTHKKVSTLKKGS